MAKDHGSSVKDDKQYEGLRKKGMSKSRAAAIANAPGSSSKGGKSSGSSRSRKSSGSGSGGKDRKSTRLNSSHGYISYAVFCLQKEKILSPRVIDDLRQRVFLLGARRDLRVAVVDG